MTIEYRKVRSGRKDHLCEGCLKRIPRGDPSTRWVGIWDGEFNSNRLCVPCDTFLYDNPEMFEDGYSSGDIGAARREDERK